MIVGEDDKVGHPEDPSGTQNQNHHPARLQTLAPPSSTSSSDDAPRGRRRSRDDPNDTSDPSDPCDPCDPELPRREGSVPTLSVVTLSASRGRSYVSTARYVYSLLGA
ncbi:hypothetical protein CRUP_032228 [Coryphaenoides rupestris]|nr:hypothetical protein CRUP_032228 [Coryphaenoides rupestris]